tara:strand:- start:392 stop:769 length:378 start_codon:yes stop_codon:yes gene_type:complete
MEKVYFTNKLIYKVYLTSTPEEDNGFDWKKDDSHCCIGDINYSDAGLVNIDDLIESLIELREKGSNYVACDWHCNHSELEVHGFNFRKSTDDEVKAEQDKLKSKNDLLVKRRIEDLEKQIAKLKS